MKFNKIAASFLACALGFAGTAMAQSTTDSVINQIMTPPPPAVQPAPQQKSLMVPATPQQNIVQPQQNVQIPEVYADYYNSLGQLRMDLINKHAELNAALNAAQPNRQQIENLGKEIGILQGKILSLQTEFQAKMKKQEAMQKDLGLNPADLPAQGPNPNSPYNWGGPRHFHQQQQGHNRYRQGYGPGYTGNYYGPGSGGWGCMEGPCWVY